MTALTFPLSLAAFQDTLSISSFRMECVEPAQEAQLADGTVIRSSLGEALWRGSFELIIQTHAEAAAAEAILALAARPGASVLLYDPRRSAPIADPDGSTISGSTPTLDAVATDRREVDVADLPSGYVLSRGDLLSFTYGSSPTRYALHRVVTGATADGTGLAADVEVTPAIRTGYSLGATITLVKPPMKAKIVGVTTGQGGPVVTTGASLEFVQTLR